MALVSCSSPHAAGLTRCTLTSGASSRTRCAGLAWFRGDQALFEHPLALVDGTTMSTKPQLRILVCSFPIVVHPRLLSQVACPMPAAESRAAVIATAFDVAGASLATGSEGSGDEGQGQLCELVQVREVQERDRASDLTTLVCELIKHSLTAGHGGPASAGGGPGRVGCAAGRRSSHGRGQHLVGPRYGL